MPTLGPVAQSGYQGRSNTASERTPVMPDGGLNGAETVLLVAFHDEGYIRPGMVPGTMGTAYDPSESSIQGGQPYAVSREPGSPLTYAVPVDDQVVTDRVWAFAYFNVSGGPDFALDWVLSPGWPTPPHGGLTDTTWIGYEILDFNTVPPGLTQRMHVVYESMFIGTDEPELSGTCPAVTWEGDLEECLVLRFVLLTNPDQATGVIEVARSDFVTIGVHPDKSIVETERFDYFVGSESDEFTGTTIDGATGVPSESQGYTSVVASEEAVFMTVVLGYGLPPADPEPEPGTGEEPFEFTNRWTLMGPLLHTSPAQATDLLERHDQELEEHFRLHGCGDFLYTYRWPTFYLDLLAGNQRAVDVMEARDLELEEASRHQGEGSNQVNDGSCEIQLTHRWPQIIDLFRDGDARAWDLLEQRDREIEAGRSACACVTEGGGEG